MRPKPALPIEGCQTEPLSRREKDNVPPIIQGGPKHLVFLPEQVWKTLPFFPRPVFRWDGARETLGGTIPHCIQQGGKGKTLLLRSQLEKFVDGPAKEVLLREREWKGTRKNLFRLWNQNNFCALRRIRTNSGNGSLCNCKNPTIVSFLQQ